MPIVPAHSRNMSERYVPPTPTKKPSAFLHVKRFMCMTSERMSVMATINIRGKEKEKKKRKKEEAEKGKYNRLTTLREVVVCSPMSRAIWRRAHALLNAINAFFALLKTAFAPLSQQVKL